MSKWEYMWDGLLGHMSAEKHSIELKSDKILPKQFSPYRASSRARVFEKRELNRMIRTGDIESAETDWAAFIVFNPKLNRFSRFSVGYRKFLAITIRNSYTLPSMDEFIDSLVKRGTDILHTLRHLQLLASRNRRHWLWRNSFFIASWAVQIFKDGIWIAKRTWHVSTNSGCNIIANNMGFEPGVPHPYYHILRECPRA